jgi:antitoxin YefM
MTMVYRLNVNELNNQFIESLKALFQDREIEIIVSAVDETAYLLQSKANAERLARAIQNVESNQNLVPVALESLQ